MFLNGVPVIPVIQTGVNLAGDGSASAPSYSFANFTNRGFYATSSILGVSVGGSAVSYFNSTGLVTNTLSFDTSSATLVLTKEADDHLFQRRTTNAQRASWANTYTGATNYEAFSLDWQTTANEGHFGTRTAATGSGRVAVVESQASSAANTYAAIRLLGQGPLPVIKAGYLTAAGANISDSSTNATYFNWGNVTNTATSGSVVNTSITPTYNQSSGTAANTDLLVNRTETAVGSGAQLLADLQVATTSKWKCDNTGKTTQTGSVVTAANSTTVAPIVMTNGTLLSAATANTLENDGAAFYQTMDTTNGRCFADGFNFFRLTSSGSGITSIADFFGSNDGIPLVANGVYKIHWHCKFSQATAGTATWTIVTATTALANLDAEYIGTNIAGQGAVGAPQMAGVTATSSSSTALPVTGTEATGATHVFDIYAIVVAGNGSSNTRLRLTMSAGTATPLADSYFTVTRLPAANTGAFVA